MKEAYSFCVSYLFYDYYFFWLIVGSDKPGVLSYMYQINNLKNPCRVTYVGHI